MDEREFQRTVVGLARTCGWLVAHFRPAQMRSGRWATPMQGDPGWVDLVLVHPRKGLGPLLRELKVGKGKLSPEQEAWRDALIACGADWALWRPDDLAEIQRVLEAKVAA